MAPRLAVVSYPLLDAADRARIDAIRAERDPRAAMIAPHFTLVFPVEARTAEVLAAVEATARSHGSFAFELRSVLAVRDTPGPGGHVFLVPENGRAELVALHAHLHGGSLRRADLPFLPHVTVGADPDFGRCEAIAGRLNGDWRTIAGRVESLTIVEIVGTVVTPIAKRRLG